MADMLTSGVSGLLAFQRALDTTSHNIANANTDGYSRQQVSLATRTANPYGSGWIGNGVDVASVRRLYDEVLASQQREANTTLKQLDAFAGYAERIDNLFSDSSTGLSSSLQQFSDAIETLSNSPTSITARQVLLSQAQTLVNRLKSYGASLGAIDSQINQQLVSEASVVSTIAKNIADVNEQVVRAQGINQQPPNDLLDQRDRLIAELAQHVSLTTVKQDNGAINVFIGSGQALVTDTTAATLRVVDGEFDKSHQRLLLQMQGTQAEVTNVVSGGTLGGVLQFRTEMLDPALNSLGQIAATLAAQVNTQQAQGLDLNGQFGTDLFAIGSVRALSSTANTGTTALTASRVDPAALTSSDYLLRYDGSAWSATRTDTGAAVTLSGSGTAASPFVVDGLSIVVSGTPAAGDTFMIQPTRDVVAGLRVVLTDPERIAAAAPMLTSATAANSGSGVIDAGTVSNPAGWVRGNYTLQFTAANAWQVLDASNTVVASGAYTSGAAINFNGMQVSVSGAPAAGDSFKISDNSAGSGDNRNLRALSDRLNQPILNGGTVSVPDAVGRFIGQIGVQTSQAQTGRDAQAVVVDNADMAMQSVSGVNLDEEAANLLRYQQAYQAAARVIAAANEMFNTLIEATRR